MSKYIDLEPKVSDYYGTSPGQERRAGICDALRFLDSHPEHVPGRTITESDYSDIAEWARNYSNRGWEGRTVLAEKGITIIPDPEPTNAEKWEKFCKQLRIDLTPWQIDYLVAAMDERGVKAPGGDDE